MNKMNTSNRPLTVKMNPAGMVEAVRQIYTSQAAICDIIDNPVDLVGSIKLGGVDKVVLDFEPPEDGTNNWSIAIGDNGPGIDVNEIEKVLSFATTEYHAVNALGRYGIGLKSAAFALGKELTIVTQFKGQNMYAVTLKETEFANGQPPKLRSRDATLSEIERFKKVFGGKVPAQGTLVIIDDTAKRFGSREAQKVIAKLPKLLGKTYYHVLEKNHFTLILKQGVRKPIVIEAEDPLLRFEKETNALHFEEITDVETPFGKKEIKITSVIVPGGTKGSPGSAKHDDQGFYFIRNGRLIMGGHNLSLPKYGKHPTTNRIRIEVQYDGDLDEAFQTTYSKDGVNPNETINDMLKKYWDEAKTTLGSDRKKNKSNPNVTRKFEITAKNQKIITNIFNDSTIQGTLLLPKNKGARTVITMFDGKQKNKGGEIIKVSILGKILEVGIDKTHPFLSDLSDDALIPTVVVMICQIIAAKTASEIQGVAPIELVTDALVEINKQL